MSREGWTIALLLRRQAWMGGVLLAFGIVAMLIPLLGISAGGLLPGALRDAWLIALFSTVLPGLALLLGVSLSFPPQCIPADFPAPEGRRLRLVQRGLGAGCLVLALLALSALWRLLKPPVVVGNSVAGILPVEFIPLVTLLSAILSMALYAIGILAGGRRWFPWLAGMLTPLALIAASIIRYRTTFERWDWSFVLPNLFSRVALSGQGLPGLSTRSTDGTYGSSGGMVYTLRGEMQVDGTKIIEIITGHLVNPVPVDTFLSNASSANPVKYPGYPIDVRKKP